MDTDILGWGLLAVGGVMVAENYMNEQAQAAGGGDPSNIPPNVVPAWIPLLLGAALVF